jgi:hypothetical protein
MRPIENPGCGCRCRIRWCSWSAAWRIAVFFPVRRICRELPVAGIDVVEVSPPYDHAEVTAMAAHRVVLEALSATAVRRAGGSVRPEDPTP